MCAPAVATARNMRSSATADASQEDAMAATASLALPLGTEAPDFRLPDPSGHLHSLSDFENDPALLVAFICNHCPYVKLIRDEFASFASDYQSRGVAVVAINPNDPTQHREDSPERMAEESAAAGYTFPYLFDETQEVAKAYRAACTPDLFLFDRQRRLVYHGQFDDARPGNGKPITGSDLRAATDALLAGLRIKATQIPSVGCSIKWRQGNEPNYLAAEA
jgi:peroxiredoxin